ncbi:MAG: type IV pilus assembly protein PilM [candidate division FCPU426 bacterium]
MFQFLKSQNLIGLDIGTHTIKAVQLKKTPEQLQLVNLAFLEVPPEIQEEADPAVRDELLARTLKQLFKDNQITAKQVVTAISGDSVIVRYVKMPHMPEEELKNVINYEAEQYIPLAIDQMVLDFEILGEVEEEGAQKLEVLLVAAKEDVIDQHIHLLQMAGLSPSVIDVDTFALQNAFETNYGRIPDETISLINVGAKLTTINILENGVTHLTRDVAVAGNNFTREIQREFDVTFAQAEELKNQEGQVLVESEDLLQMEISKKEDNATRIGEAISPVLNKLVAEIQRSFDYYESTIRKKPISRIVLSGGAARLKNLDKYLAEKFNLKVEINDPFKEILIPDKKFDLDFIQRNAQMFNIAVGLALRSPE